LQGFAGSSLRLCSLARRRPLKKAINNRTQCEGYKMKAKAQATRVGSKAEAEAFKAEALTGSVRPVRSRKEPLWRRWAACGPAAEAQEAKAVEVEKARDAPASLCLYRNIHGDMP
jgi:hypothetical protein